MVITVSTLLEICAGISCVGLAIGYLVRGFKAVKKPVNDLNEKFAHYDECLSKDKKRLNELSATAEANTQCMKLLLESTMAILGHLEDGNHTKMLSEKKAKIESYLYGQIQ